MTKYLNIFLLTITLLLYFGSGNATEKFPFEKVEIEAPFHNLLLHYPGFMQEGGARLFADHKGDLALIGIAKLVLEDSQPENILQIRRIGEIRARAAILELRDGVEISTSRGLKEGSLPAREIGERISLASFFQVTETRVEGVIQQLPIIGTWWSANNTTFYVAIGKMVGASQCQTIPSNDSNVKKVENAHGLIDMEGEEPFVSLLRSSPVLCQNGGVRGFVLGTDRKVLMAVGAARFQGSWAKARKVARLKALRSLLGHNQRIQISSVEYLSDKEHLRLSKHGEQHILLSEFLSIQEERVSGMVKALPIIATWEDPKGDILHVAVGKVWP